MSRTRIESVLRQAYPDVSFEVLTPPDPTIGDYSTNIAFALAKHEKKNPLAAAADVIALFGGAEWLDRTEMAHPGFVNFFLKREFLQKELAKIHEHRDHYGEQEIGNGKTVIVEYSSPNIAKPMHVGHLRSTVIGDALANVYEALGYKIIRWNYISDWGTQFGKLIVAYKRWRDEMAFKENPIQEMLRIYVKFHQELDTDPELEKEAQREFKKLEDGNVENRGIWKLFRDKSLDEFNAMYRQLDVGLITDGNTITKGEGDYEGNLKELIEKLKEKKLAKESQGALIIDLEADNLSPALIQKSDGGTLYLTRDIASLEDRITHHDPSKILYVIGNEQTLHLQQLFAIARLLHFDSTELVHVKFGLVLGESGKKLATREGRIIPLQEVIDKITELARGIVQKKNPELPEERAEEIAKTIGIGALKYGDLRQHPHTDITFDWDAMLDLGGNSGPYLQYTYARLASILAKARSTDSGQAGGHSTGDASLLDLPQERALMKHLLDFPYVIQRAAQQYALNGIALYLYELANFANRFYECVRVLESETDALRDARLVLVETVAATLGRGLKLLGIQPLERV